MKTTRKYCTIAGATALLIGVAAPGLLFQHGARAATLALPSAVSSAALDSFASQVETLGVMKYPNSFTEADLNADGTTDVYLVTQADQDFVSAVNTLNSGMYPVKFIGTPRSYAQLDALAAQVPAAAAKLKDDGVIVADWYPDAVTGTEVIDVETPAAASVSKLASAEGRAVTAAGYPAVAASVLQGVLGSGVTMGKEVSSHASVQVGQVNATVVDRAHDVAPFYGGDGLVFPGDAICTGGFNVSNSHGSPFMLSAGHCGNGTVTNGAGTVGKVSSNWYSSTSGYDVLAIAISSALGRVWLNNTAWASVAGTQIPAVGSPITFNGYATGRKTVTVNRVDFNEPVEDGNGNVIATLAHQILGGQNTANVCSGGDSGGPAFTPSGGSSVYATGIIDSTLEYDDGSEEGCLATIITSILSSKSLSLITG